MRNSVHCKRTALYLAAAALLAGSAACGPPPEGPVERLVGSLPADQFQFGGDSLDEVFRWELGAGNGLGAWTIRADRRVEQRDEFLHLAGSDRSSLVRAVNLDADDVDRIIVHQEGLRHGQTRVYWARRGEQFAAERQVALRVRDAVDGLYEFPVSEHPEWNGRIVRFRFDATNSPDDRVSVASIVGARARSDLAGGAHGQPWTFEFLDELRAGILVTPEQPQVRRLPAGDEARLYFATSLVLSPEQGPARMSVSRLHGGGREQLYERRIDPGRREDRGWATARVELDAPSGDGVELQFAIECPESDRCAGTFASIETRSGGPPQRPNVLLISIDTLRADRMSLYGHERPTTPNIDRWAASSGVTFERVVAASPWTLPSHVSMLTGLDPTTHNVNFNSPIPEAVELLSERLHDDGYFTAAVTGGGFAAPSFGLWQGFDVFAYWQRSVERYWKDQTASGTELPSGLQRVSGLLDELDGRPFFLFFHTYEVHSPFHAQLPYFEQFHGELPEQPGAFVTTRPRQQVAGNGYKLYRTLFLNMNDDGIRRMADDEVSLARTMYDSGVAFTDAHLGALFQELETRGLLANTIVVLTSDHGEMLGEMGLAGHAYLHEENVRVPLVIAWPDGFDGGSRVDEMVRTADIAPTILDLLGHELPDGLDGISLAPWTEGRAPERAPDALTYAASSNHGLSLRMRNDLVYVYDNSLWRSGRVDRLAPVDPDSSAASLDFSDRADELHDRIEQLLESRAGLHMALVNSADAGDFTVRLRGGAVRREKLKATRLECACATWIPEGSTAELRVPAGHDFGLQLEDAAGGVLFIEVREGDREVFSTEVDLAALNEPIAVARSPAGWARSELRDAEVERGLAVWWIGGVGAGGDATLDEELARRLRALGYLR